MYVSVSCTARVNTSVRHGYVLLICVRDDPVIYHVVFCVVTDWFSLPEIDKRVKPQSHNWHIR